MSIKDALERKHRRVVVVPVQVSDPSTTVQQMQGISAALAVARENDDEAVGSLSQQLVELEAQYQTHFASVRMQSLPAREWEEATSLYLDESGRFDWTSGLPELLAASCVDPDLKDAAWWKDQLAAETWTDGDVKALQAGILHLNSTAMDVLIPKD